MWVHIKDVSKEGCFKAFDHFKENLIYEDVKNHLAKDSHFIKSIYINCFFTKYYTIQECVEMRKSEVSGNVEDFIQEATKKIESARQLFLNKLVDQKFKDELKFEFDVKYCDKETVNCIMDFLNSLKQEGIDPKITIRHGAYGFEKEELINLMDLKEFLQNDFNVEEKFKDSFSNEDVSETEFEKESFFTEDPVSFDRTVEAYKKMEEEIERIKDLNLSPFEQFLYVHDFVANRIYNMEEKGMDIKESRAFVNAMTGDYIVCVGYAAILEKFCEKLGIECKRIVGGPLESGDLGHAANVVNIVDEKYGINGQYFCDACYDCKKNQYDFDKHYFYAALPLQDVKHIEQSKYFNEILEGYKGDKESKVIPIAVFEQALTSLYSKIEGEKFNEVIIKSNLMGTIRDVSNANSIEGENAFSVRYRCDTKIKETIANGEELSFKQLKHIFKNIDISKELDERILRLLNEVNEEKKEYLVGLLNKHFKFNSLGHGYSVTCKNKLILPALYMLDKGIKKQVEQDRTNTTNKDFEA